MRNIGTKYRPCLYCRVFHSSIYLTANGTFCSPMALNRAEKWMSQSTLWLTTIFWSPCMKMIKKKKLILELYKDVCVCAHFLPIFFSFCFFFYLEIVNRNVSVSVLDVFHNSIAFLYLKVEDIAEYVRSIFHYVIAWFYNIR